MGNRPHRSIFIYYIYLNASLAYVVYHLIDHIGKGQYNKTSNYDTAVRGYTLISGMTLWSTLCDTESEATLLNITHLIIAQLTLNYLLGIMAGRHGGRRENAERKSNQEIGNAANPTGNSMDRWLRGEESKVQEEEQNTNDLTEEQQRHAVEQEQTARAARGEATVFPRRI